MRSTLAEPGAEQRVFDKVFKKDIERLLSMEDMWKHRKPPAPLSYAVLSQQAAQTPSSSAPTASGIKDQRELSLGDAFGMFQDSLKKLTARVQAGGPNTTLDWDKDDDDALDFATAAANLRAHIFDIPSKTRFDVKGAYRRDVEPES
jgi:ubiquitin-like 1-activating enzyme E1 B